jgi:hypothetical protein
MLTAACALFALAQIALSFGAVRLWSRRHSIGALTLALPIAALVWDNAVVGLGSFIGEGTLLTALTYPRFVGHALLTPIWIVTAYEFARRDGVPWLQGRGARAGAWLLYGAMVAIGSVASLVLLRLEPVRGGGLVYYTNAGGLPGPPAPAIVMVVTVLVAGALLLRRSGWPWMLAGGAFMFVAAAVPARLVGFWLSNTGEVALGLALVLTERFLQSREASGGADSGAGSRGERA